jgi:predicted nucleic acid-binding protein
MYLDSAIIVKLLVLEPESNWFEAKLSGHSFETSELSRAEVCSALLFKERAGEITAPERIKATEQFFSMIEDKLILSLPLNLQVVERARAIQLACHPRIPLRTLDALHVATCDLDRSSVMASTDGRIREACKQLGVTLLPKEIQDIVHAS